MNSYIFIVGVGVVALLVLWCLVMAFRPGHVYRDDPAAQLPPRGGEGGENRRFG